MNISKEFKEIKEIGLRVLMTVQAKGDGLCLYLTKNLTETYDIAAGDRIEAQLRRHYRQKV